MDRGGATFERNQEETNSSPLRELNLGGSASVYKVMLSYQALQGGQAGLREKHHMAMKEVLQVAINTYDGEMREVSKGLEILKRQEVPSIGEVYRLKTERQRIIGDLKEVTASTSHIHFPESTLVSMSGDFINEALNGEKSYSHHTRRAAADIGLSLGGEELADEKFDIFANKLIDLLTEHHKHPNDPRVAAALIAAEKNLPKIGAGINLTEGDSVMAEIAQIAQKRGKTLVAMGTAAGLAAVILNPVAAIAADSKPTTSHSAEASAPATSHSKIPQIAVGMASNANTTQTKNVATATPKNSKAIPSINVQMAAPNAVETVSTTSKATATSTAIPSSISTPEVHATIPSVEVGMSTGANTSNASQAEATPISKIPTPEVTSTTTAIPSIEVGLAAPNPAPSTTLTTSPNSETATPTSGSAFGENTSEGSSPNTLSQVNASDPANIPSSISATPVITVSTPEASSGTSTSTSPESSNTSLTPEQIIQSIQNTIENDEADESVPIASSIIQGKFGTHGASNSALLSSVQSLENTVEDTITSGGHPNNATYNNNSLMALAVLDAAASDETIFKQQTAADGTVSNPIAELIKNIQRPSDKYEGKLFDQYVTQAQTLLAAAPTPSETTPATPDATTNTITAVSSTTTPDATTSPINPLEATSDIATNTAQTIAENANNLTSSDTSSSTETATPVVTPTSLLEGYSADEQKTITTLYAYALMAADSDSKQASEIANIKSAEAAAKAKAEQLAKASAEANSKSAHQGNVESAAIEHLINTTSDPTAKNGYLIMQYFMNKGLTDFQAAAFVGDFYGESGNLQPNTNQDGGGPGYGLAQWEFHSDGKGRADDLKRYAEAQGLDMSDLNTQLAFSWDELTNGYSNVLAQVKAATTQAQATDIIMRYYEVPEVVVLANEYPNDSSKIAAMQTESNRRYQLGVPFLSALDNVTGTIQHQRAAEAQAAAHALKVKKEQEAAAAKAAEQQQQSAAQKIVSAAQAQLALWENGTFRPLANMEPGKTDYLAYSNQTHTNWCADFVSTVVENAGLTLPDSAGSNAVVHNVKENLLSTGNYTWHDAGSYVPSPGDIAFYGKYDHINIVTSDVTGPTSYMSIGGNEGNFSAPAYAAAYGGKGAYHVGGNAYDNSYVENESDAYGFGGNVIGFLSHN